MLGSSSRMTAARQLQAYVNVINAMKAAPGLKQLVIVSDGAELAVASREQQMDFQPRRAGGCRGGRASPVCARAGTRSHEAVEDRSMLWDNQVRRADNLALTEWPDPR